jgi:hypothetical protein
MDIVAAFVAVTILRIVVGEIVTTMTTTGIDVRGSAYFIVDLVGKPIHFARSLYRFTVAALPRGGTRSKELGAPTRESTGLISYCRDGE